MRVSADLKVMRSEHGRRFVLDRQADETGTSGTGRVAWGVQFPDGTCVLRWATEFSSTAVYESITHLSRIHGHGGQTAIVWIDTA